MHYTVFDLETTSEKVHDRTANPFFNKILAVGYKLNNVKEIIAKSKEKKEISFIGNWYRDWETDRKSVV